LGAAEKATFLPAHGAAGVLDVVEVREARPSDKEPLMSFIKDIWGGHDYIPQVWDEWIGDRSAKMFVVVADGKPVAMNRVRLLEDGSAWFEGVRVHPDYRGRGLATELGENSLKAAVGMGARVFRLTSSSRNRSAHRQVARMKFAEVGRVSVYEPGKGMRFSPQEGVRVATPADSEMVTRVVEGSEGYRLGAGVMWDGFSATSLTPRVMAARIQEGGVFLGHGAVAISKPGREGKEVWRQVCFVAGKPAPAVRLVRHVFGTGGKADWKLVFVPQGSRLIGALREEGFRRSFSLVLFERKAANG
jgi:GNAT superfamily N-acetyltransferase